MNKEINIGDLGVFSGRVDKKVKVIRVDEKYVTYLIIDENKKKYIYLEDFKKKFKKEGDSILEKGESKIESKIKKIAEQKKAKNTSKPIYTIVGVIYHKDKGDIEETEDLQKIGIKGYRIRYNKEPKMYFGYVEYDENNLQEAKKRLEYLNERAEKQKEIQKIREAENKIKREENKTLEKAKLEAANKQINKKMAYLMTLNEYKDKVVPILQEYQKFLRKNSQYLQSAGYEGIYQYTYPELEADFENNTIKGQRFAISKYKENPLSDFKASHYATDEIVETNKSFVNKLKNFFTDDEIYSQISKDEFKSNKRAVRRAIDNDVYKKLLDSGELTESELETIAKSVDVAIPKKVFSVENVKAKEMKSKFEKLLVDLPTISKEQLNKLIESIKIDFKPLEEEVFTIEKARYTKTFEELESEGKVYETKLNYVISIWQELFTYDKRGYDEIKTGTFYRSFGSRPAQEIIEQKYYVTGLKLKSDWETTFDKFLKDYIDTLKYSFISAIINNFTRITKPITEFEKLRIRKGEKGFEGVYRFKFNDGSYFDFKAEAIRAGGYNIQVLHLRYITNFENITLSDGTKVTGYSSLIENFNVKRMEKGGLIVDSSENLVELLKKTRENKIKEWYKHGYKVVVARNDGYVYILDNQRDAEFIDSKSISQRKILDIIKNNPNINEISFRGTIKVGDRVGDELEIADDFNVILWKKEQSFKKGGLTHDDIKNKTDKYKDILKKPSNLLKISQMHKVPVEFLQSQLVKGMKVEGEHTTREAVAKIIALHHLEEDPRYYIKLEEIEGNKMDDGGLVYKKLYNKGGGSYTTIINGMLYNINKQYERDTWVAQSDDGEYYKETQTLSELKDYLKNINKENFKKGGELDPDNVVIKSAMTHKAGSAGGLLVGKRHSEGGIKAINKSTNSPIEMEGGEVVITRNAVSDDNKREFEGQMLTNRQILSKINESGGGVSFASGGDVPSSCKCSGKSYKYGGEMISDYDIVKRINSKY